MGYHVSIVRTNGGKGNPITEQEVIDFASKSPGFRIEHPPTPKGQCTVLVYSRDGQDVCGLQLDERDGVLWTKNPEDAELEVMLSIAAALGARVKGDENETYKTISDTYVHPDDQADREAASAEDARFRKAWQRRQTIWRWIQILGALTLVIGLVVTYFRK